MNLFLSKHSASEWLTCKMLGLLKKSALFYEIENNADFGLILQPR